MKIDMPELNESGGLKIPETVDTSIILINKNGIILYASQDFTKMTGYYSNELIGKNIKEIRSDNNHKDKYQKLWKRILSGKEWSGRISNKTKDGKVLDLWATITPVKNASGEITHFIETKENLEARKIQAKKMEQMQRLSQLGRISGSLLHELKSHYALIKMNMDLFEPKSRTERHYYLIIKSDLDKLNKYFQNVLQYLRDRDFDMTNVNLHDVVENSFSFIRPLISTKSIEFDNRVDSTVIKADYQQLQSVFKNLIQNSADAIEKEGRIEAWSERANGFIKVHFKDNGPGIANPDKIFEPFYSTKSSGSGLGLTIAERIMKKHNGSLALSKSRKGETLFELKFPGMEYEQNSNN